MAQELMLIDTDVLMWMIRGYAGAVQRLAQIKAGLAMSKAHILPVTPHISKRAMVLVNSHALAQGLQLRDALIAAAVFKYGQKLFTGNKRNILRSCWALS